MPLNDIAVRQLKPRAKSYKISDSNGLFVLIKPNGTKYWRFGYRYAGKQKGLAFGVYPEVTIKEARDRRDEARKQIRDGIDPAAQKKAVKLQTKLHSLNTFRLTGEDWLVKQEHSWTPKHLTATKTRLESNIYPFLGNRPIKDITTPELLAVIKKIEARGAVDLAHRAIQTVGQIYRYAIQIGLVERNIADNLRGSLKAQKKKNHAYLQEADLPEFLKKLDSYDGEVSTKIALNLLLLNFVRTTELRAAAWSEFNFEKQEWRIPASRMKMRTEHIVPLAQQSIELLNELRLINGNREHLFPNRNNPTTFMSENTMLYALYRLGYHSRTTGHGFRATASTILNEKDFNPEVIELQLAHRERNSVRASYNHAQRLGERREMMVWWGNFIESLKS